MQQNVGRHQIKGKFVIVFIGKKGIKIHVEFIDSKLDIISIQNQSIDIYLM